MNVNPVFRKIQMLIVTMCGLTTAAHWLLSWLLPDYAGIAPLAGFGAIGLLWVWE